MEINKELVKSVNEDQVECKQNSNEILNTDSLSHIFSFLKIRDTLHVEQASNQLKFIIDNRLGHLSHLFSSAG